MVNAVDLSGNPQPSPSSGAMSRSASSQSLSGSRFTPYVRSSPMNKSRSDSISHPSAFSPLRRDASTSSLISQGSPIYPSPYNMSHSASQQSLGMSRSQSMSTFDMTSPSGQRIVRHGGEQLTPLHIVPRDLNKDLFDQYEAHRAGQQQPRLLPNGMTARDTPPTTPNRHLMRRQHSNSTPPVPSGLHYPRPPSPPASAAANMGAYPPSAFEAQPQTASWGELTNGGYTDEFGYDGGLQHPMAQLQIGGDPYTAVDNAGGFGGPGEYYVESYLSPQSAGPATGLESYDGIVNGQWPVPNQSSPQDPLAFQSGGTDQFQHSPYIHPSHQYAIDPQNQLQMQQQLSHHLAHSQSHPVQLSHSTSSLYSQFPNETNWADQTLVGAVAPQGLEQPYQPASGAGYLQHTSPYLTEGPPIATPDMVRSASVPGNLYSPGPSMYAPSPLAQSDARFVGTGILPSPSAEYGMYSLAEEEGPGLGPSPTAFPARPGFGAVASASASTIHPMSGVQTPNAGGKPGMSRSQSYSHSKQFSYSKGLAGPIELEAGSPLAQSSVGRYPDDDVFVANAAVTSSAAKPSLRHSPSSGNGHQSPSRATGQSIRMQKSFTSPTAGSHLYASTGSQHTPTQQTPTQGQQAPVANSVLSRSARDGSHASLGSAVNSPASAAPSPAATVSTPGSASGASPRVAGGRTHGLMHKASGSWSSAGGFGAKHPTSDLMGADANGRACLPGL